MRNGEPAAAVGGAIGLAPILPWYERVAAIGHGRPEPMSPEAAFTAAREAEPARITAGVAMGLPDGLTIGRPVTVTSDDFARVPVEGRLVAVNAERVVIRRETSKVGPLHLHVPRAGFELAAKA